MARPVILVSIDHYLPGFRAGGPARSIANMVELLSDEFDFRIVTSDRDLGAMAPYREVEVGRWTQLGRGSVLYLPNGSRSPAVLRGTPHDVLYLNSFFSRRATMAPLLARLGRFLPDKPVVLAPRGEFSSGALQIKARRKTVYLRTSKAISLFGGITWAATSQFEADDIRRVLGEHASRIAICPNLPARLPATSRQRAPVNVSGPLKVLFLSRISPMKNLGFAFDALALVKNPVVFTIVGPAEDRAYFDSCRRKAEALPSNIRVEWKDPVEPKDVDSVMASHDLFFLPTLGENFGHAIAEALGAGTPVLISDRTPWRDLEKLGIGFDFSLDNPAAYANAIDRMAQLPPEEYRAWQDRAAAFARDRQDKSGDVELNRRLFRDALASGRR